MLPPGVIDAAPSSHLRDYQVRAVEDTLAALHENPILVSPTGSGKTVAAVEIVRRFDGRVLWVAHRRELIMQARDHLAGLGLDAGIILANEYEHREKRVQVGSVQTLARREKPPASLLVIDEAHHAPSDSYRDLAAAYPMAYRLGLTATPFRLDGKGLGSIIDKTDPASPHMFGRIIVAARVGDLCKRGYLVCPTYFAPAAPDMSGARITGGDYREDDSARIMDTPVLTGNIVETWKLRAKGRRTLVFAVTVAHAQHLCEAFAAAGVRSDVLHGGTPKPERDAKLRALREGQTEVLCNCMVLTEGYDLPALEVAVIARPTASLCLHLQMLGRIMRACPGKAGALVLDHAGNRHRLGKLTQNIVYTLSDEEKPEREQDDEKECPSCHLFVDRFESVCPECGYEFGKAERELPVSVPGELIEHAEDNVEERVPFEERERMWDQWIAIAQSRDYKTGWAAVRYKALYGAWPTRIGDRLIDPPNASIADRYAVWQSIDAARRERGFKAGWTSYRWKAIFGAWPPYSWARESARREADEASANEYERVKHIGEAPF